MIHLGRWSVGALLALSAWSARAEIDPADRAERWWDASRADRIGFSDRAAAQCRSSNCDSLQIRSCINETVKPPMKAGTPPRTLADVTATCISDFRRKP